MRSPAAAGGETLERGKRQIPPRSASPTLTHLPSSLALVLLVASLAKCLQPDRLVRFENTMHYRVVSRQKELGLLIPIPRFHDFVLLLLVCQGQCILGD